MELSGSSRDNDSTIQPQMIRRILILTVVLLSSSLSEAQNRDSLRFMQVDSMLTRRYYKTSYDTNYVVRPAGRLTLKVRFNQSGDDFHVRSEMSDVSSKADLSTSFKTTVSIGASYRGLSASLAINPVKIFGSYKDQEFNLAYYGSRLGVDASYHRSTTLSGDVRRNGQMERLEAGDVNLEMINLAGYYIFNHRRFSYSAAFTQSYIPRRSAGSWLLGLSYQGGNIETRDELKEKKSDAPDVYIRIGHLGIGGGYGYNWVLGEKWLLHFSMLPSFVVYTNSYMKTNGERKDAKHMRFNMIFNEHVAIVYNFSPLYFAGATLVMDNSVFSDDIVKFNQNKWLARFSLGMRL